MKHGTQKVTSYRTASGIKVYEIKQYNSKDDHWYIVGSCSPSKVYLQMQVDHNNLLVEYGLRGGGNNE